MNGTKLAGVRNVKKKISCVLLISLLTLSMWLSTISLVSAGGYHAPAYSVEGDYWTGIEAYGIHGRIVFHQRSFQTSWPNPANVWSDISLTDDGENTFETLMPNGVGSYTNLLHNTGSGNWQCVAEDPPDGDTSIVYSDPYSDSELVDTYSLTQRPPPSSPGMVVYNVTVSIVVKSLHSRYKAIIRPVIYIGGSLWYGDYFSPPTSWTTYSYAWLVNPATNSQWTASDLNALQAGVSIASGDYRQIYFYPGYCTQVKVTCYYLSPPNTNMIEVGFYQDWNYWFSRYDPGLYVSTANNGEWSSRVLTRSASFDTEYGLEILRDSTYPRQWYVMTQENGGSWQYFGTITYVHIWDAEHLLSMTEGDQQPSSGQNGLVVTNFYDLKYNPSNTWIDWPGIHLFDDGHVPPWHVRTQGVTSTAWYSYIDW